MTRTEARKNAFLMIFSLYANDTESIAALQEPLELEDGETLEADSFCRSLVELTGSHLPELDAAVAAHLQGWTMERLPKVSLAILRLSAAQLLYMPEIPVGAVINEAVELAKHYGDRDDYAFVNGALGNLARSLPQRGDNAAQTKAAADAPENAAEAAPAEETAQTTDAE